MKNREIIVLLTKILTHYNLKTWTISGPNNQTGWVGKLNDVRIVKVRNWSSNNKITLEIQSRIL